MFPEFQLPLHKHFKHICYGRNGRVPPNNLSMTLAYVRFRGHLGWEFCIYLYAVLGVATSGWFLRRVSGFWLNLQFMAVVRINIKYTV